MATPAARGGPGALLLVWTDIPAKLDTEFNDWYNREHLRERIEVPGFVRGRRFEALSGAPKYLALYEARSAKVLQSAAYLRLKKRRKDRDMRFISVFRNTIKATCDVLVRAGTGEGAFLVLLPIVAERQGETALREWLATCLFPELLQQSGLMCAVYGVHNDAARGASAEHDTRAGDRHMERLIMVEAASESGAKAVMAQLNPAALAGHAMRADLVDGPRSFRVLYTLHR